MVFTITLNQPLTSALTVNVTASPGSASADDFAPVSTQVIFAPGETQKSVSVPVLTDFVSEPSETITLTISAQGVNISDAAAVGQIIDVAPPAGPNFIATGFRREPGPLLLPGRRYDAIVTVQNAGNERSRANVTVDLYASTDDTVDEGDILLSTSTARLTLSPGRSSNRRLRFAAPLLESDRNVRLIAVVSSSAQETSPSDQLASSGTTTIQRAFVDPAATALTAPRTLRPGRSVTLTLTTRNQGNITLTQMYSAVVNIVDSSNQVVATTTVSVMLRTAAGRSERDRLRIAIPADLAPGDYTFTTTLVPPGTFSDSTLANNRAQTTRVSTVRSPR